MGELWGEPVRSCGCCSSSSQLARSRSADVSLSARGRQRRRTIVTFPVRSRLLQNAASRWRRTPTRQVPGADANCERRECANSRAGGAGRANELRQAPAIGRRSNFSRTRRGVRLRGRLRARAARDGRRRVPAAVQRRRRQSRTSLASDAPRRDRAPELDGVERASRLAEEDASPALPPGLDPRAGTRRRTIPRTSSAASRCTRRRT